MRKKYSERIRDVIYMQVYPYPLQPVNLIVEQHLSVWQVNVAVVGIVQKMSE